MDDPELEHAARMLAWADPSAEGDDPVCEWCGVVVPGGASAYAPYCSLGCAREAEASDWLGERAQAAPEEEDEDDR
jgi:endogenous inhibitor of DNA gyrase (YacG/DUF329 family)